MGDGLEGLWCLVAEVFSVNIEILILFTRDTAQQACAGPSFVELKNNGYFSP